MHLSVGSSKPCCGNYSISEFRAYVKRFRNCFYSPSHLVFLSSRSASLHRKGGSEVTTQRTAAYSTRLHWFSIQLFRGWLSEKTVHATIPKGTIGYDQYTVSNDCSCRTYFGCFPLALANIASQTCRAILSNFSEEQCTQNHPQYLFLYSRQ